MRPQNREAGFTLLSVMLAVMLLSVGVLGVVRTQSLVLSAHTAAATRTGALEIARAYLEDLRSRDPGTLQTEAPVQVDETGVVNTQGRYTRSVQVQSVSSSLVRVTVTVTTPTNKNGVSLMTMAFVNPNPT
ncbi:MAG TPA: prepilin-type N-terminal cleavage/methylation domain-containing protein [Gemmatimonadales bacterium]|nr:prepilin-type N-terminal cleavage/methylation domain-containing protein [Gemmatimonadales bacterium]